MMNVTNQTMAENIVQAVNWTLWIKESGGSPVPLKFSTNTSIAASVLADDYINRGGNSSPANFTEYSTYYSNLKVVFLLEFLARLSEMTPDIIFRIDRDLNITGDPNPEVKQRWYPLAIYVGYFPAFQSAHDWVSSQGRMKYINPVYKALNRYGFRHTAL